MALSCSHQAAHLVEEDDRFVIYAPAIMNAEVVAYQGDIQQIKTLGVGQQRLKELLDMAQLSEYENYYIHELSGGMKQRVALLRAMACDPKVLLMDEPLGAVDFQMRQLLQMQLEQMLMQKKTTALMVTHDVDEAVYLSDRVIVMSRDYGRILTDLRIDLPRPRDRTHVMYHNYVDHLTNVLKSALNGDVKSDEDKDLLEFIQKSELEKNRLHNALFGDADKK